MYINKKSLFLAHKRKKARINSGPPPQINDDDFVITPPPSPRRLGIELHLKKKTTNRAEAFTEYQDRLIEG